MTHDTTSSDRGHARVGSLVSCEICTIWTAESHIAEPRARIFNKSVFPVTETRSSLVVHENQAQTMQERITLGSGLARERLRGQYEKPNQKFEA